MIHGKSSPNKCHAELLAPELLTVIFHNVIVLHERNPTLMIPISRNHPEDEFDAKPLLSISHVCAYWRDVALENPALWRRIDGRCRDQLEVFLKRSRPLTVTLFLDVQHWDVKLQEHRSSAASIVNTHGARLRRLDLSIHPTRRYVVPLLGSLQAPHLECLTLTSPPIYHSLEDSRRLSWIPLLNEDASSLRALAIMPVIDWMPSCTFPLLTHLFISFDRYALMYHPFDVLQLLSNTPALVFLHINLLLFNVHHTSEWKLPSNPISLRQLHSLVFTSCVYDLMHAVLSHLSLPQDVFIRLQDILKRDNLPLPFPLHSLRPVTSLDISTRNNEVLVVADGSTSGLWFEGHYDGMEDEPVDWGAWLLQLHRCLTLSHVTYLHISIIDGDPIFRPEFLAQLSQVSQLDVLLREPSEFHQPPPDAAVLSSTAILCCALSPTTMLPIRCPLLRELTIEWHGQLTVETTAEFPQIPAMLAARARAGHPVHRLIIQAAPHLLSSDPSAVTALDIFYDLAGPLLRSGSTAYEMAERQDGAKGLCAFEMRDVWRVDGEEKYWEVDDYDKPHYSLGLPWAGNAYLE